MAPQDLRRQQKLDSLSSRKLWELFELTESKRKTLQQKKKSHKHTHQHLSEVLRQELLLRNDFDEGEAWKMPH